MSGYEGLIIAGIAAAASAAGTVVAARQQADVAEFNAEVATQNMEAAVDEGRIEEERRRRIARRALAKDRTAVGASGILVEGSPLDLIEDNAAQLEVQSLQARREAQLRARGFNVDRSISRFEAGAARTRGTMGAAADLLGGASNVYQANQRRKLLQGA